jgi:hypothetical protein
MSEIYNDYPDFFHLAGIRTIRNRLLIECDWRVLPDYPHSDKQAWIDYRQALRDFPETCTDVRNPEWPAKPN